MASATDDFQMNLDGLDGLEELFEELPDQLQKYALNDATRAGANVIARAARKNVRLLGKRTTRGRRGDKYFLPRVGVRKGHRRARSDRSAKFYGAADGYYQITGGRTGHLWEYGTAERQQKRSGGKDAGRKWRKGQARRGRRTGRFPAKPFMGPAVQAKEMEAVEVTVEALWKAVQKQARRARDRGL